MGVTLKEKNKMANMHLLVYTIRGTTLNCIVSARAPTPNELCVKHAPPQMANRWDVNRTLMQVKLAAR